MNNQVRVIAGGRGTGKTSDLIRESARTGFYIVTNSHRSAYLIVQMAKEMGADIPFPLTYEEFMRREYHVRGIRGLLFDDVDLFMQTLTNVPIVAMTINIDGHDKIDPGPQRPSDEPIYKRE